MSFSLETTRVVWCDKHGECTEVGPDRDGVGLLELRQKSSDGKIIGSVTLQTEMARLVARAMLTCADELDALAAEERKGRQR